MNHDGPSSAKATFDAPAGSLRQAVCWAIAAFWLTAFLVSVLRAGAPLGTAAGGLQALALLVLIAVHGSLSYGWRGILAFVVVAVLVSFGFEACSIATGFPFGFYAHHQPGPKPLGVPLAVPIGYAFLGWFAWTLARLMVRDDPSISTGLDRFTTPLIATFILAGYDLAYDPIGADILKLWTYRHPSGQFGVPLTNFLGWLLTGWTFFQIFALVESRFTPSHAAKRAAYWLLPCLIWMSMALQYPILFATSPAEPINIGGRTFILSDVYEASSIISLFTLIFTSLTSMVRLTAIRQRWGK